MYCDAFLKRETREDCTTFEPVSIYSDCTIPRFINKLGNLYPLALPIPLFLL